MPVNRVSSATVEKLYTHSSRSTCALCVAVADATSGAEPFLHNCKLMETHRFLVLPSVGPIFPGHVLAVSKAHFSSLAAMGAEAIAEYEDLAARLRKAPFLSDGVPLEAEHGSTDGDKAGACVVHTHVHWIPGAGRFWKEFPVRLPRRKENTLLELAGHDCPYLFTRADKGTAIFNAAGLRSQTIRRILCELMERDDTDWMQALRPTWIKETVAAWKECAGND